MSEKSAGYREIEHMSDWELEVWAPDLPELLRQAAQGMNSLAGVKLQAGPRCKREIELQADDSESLLVDFLSELLYLGETENLAFDRMEINIDGNKLHAQVEGAPVAQLGKEIKAVTYHQMKIREREGELRVHIVFDV
jgi:SHS2 domain-containing protein